MSETKNKKKNGKNEREVYSVPYTKAGLASKNSESENETATATDEQKQSSQPEHTPKIGKKESVERDHDKPIH